ncbi:TIGR02452 family protein [Streptomyces sp. H10-C2]|uniref:TIGR02452 family protein n=1 Tax=unclassified Streptomyces TaxID=2593676 RepID=UPI0024B95D29|nr:MULTISPECIES: TIGR02452 family protein [unclassified Streptomyces]MDJ0342164.1 TIGR02452 family protein [Streptomyces sp. PH10-H1]MDJ0368678.1 TIGR02452 family protein [Streptomyces sp. H10-C2]
MSARLRGIARHTQEIVAAGRYLTPSGREVVIGDSVARAVTGTRLFGPGPVDVPPPTGRPAATAFGVTGESSLQAARRLKGSSDEPVAVLNFSSARNPGGGYLNGAQAQEESLCRGSALYACVVSTPDFYAVHRAVRDPFYTDRVIHSPAVPVFRDDRGALLEEPYGVGFLTSPAPNAGVITRTLPDQTDRIPRALASRAERVLEVAAAQGYRRLVLGAWGCGVFQCDPAQVAHAFHTHLAGAGRFAGSFDEVVFPVLDRRADSPTRAAFAAVFNGRDEDHIIEVNRRFQDED